MIRITKGQTLITAPTTALLGAASASGSVWVRLNAPYAADGGGGYLKLAAFADDGGHSIGGTFFSGISGQFATQIYPNAAGSNGGNLFGYSVASPLTYHVAWAWSGAGSDGDLKTWVNGTLLNETTGGLNGTLGRVASASLRLALGDPEVTGPLGIDITIDDPVFWSGYVLTSANVLAIRNGTDPRTIAPTSVVWAPTLVGTAGAVATAGDAGLTSSFNGTVLPLSGVTGSPTYQAGHLVYTPPASCTRAVIGGSGATIGFILADGSGNPAILNAAPTTNPTVVVNGGSPVTLTNPNWGVTFASDPLPFVAYPLASPVGPTDVVTVSAPRGWVTTTIGECEAFAAMAAENHTGGSIYPVAVSAPAMKVGQNFGAPGFNQVVMPYANIFKGAGDYSGTGTAYLVVPDSSPVADGNVYYTFPNNETVSLQWQGGTDANGMTLGEISGQAGAACSVLSTYPKATAYGWETRAILTAATALRSPLVAVTKHQAGITGVRAYLLTGIDISNPPQFRPEIMRMAGGMARLRFMDATDINNSCVVDYSDYAQPGQDSYVQTTNRTYGGTLASVGPYSNPDGYFTPNPGGAGIPILLTFAAPHGIKDRQRVTIENLVGPSDPTGTPSGTFPTSGTVDTVSINNLTVAVRVVSSTTVAFAHGPDAGGSGAAGQVIAGTYAAGGTSPKATGYSQVNMPPEDCIDLCNQLGIPPHLCIPPAMNDAGSLAFANMVAARLKPGLVVHVEYANETWNTGFDVNHYAECMGNIHTPKLTGGQWQTLRAGQHWTIWRDAFVAAGRPATDVRRCLGSFVVSATFVGEERVAYAVANGIGFDSIEIAPYYDAGPLEPSLATRDDALSLDQTMDLTELYLLFGPLTAGIAAHVKLLSDHGLSGTVAVNCYESGPQYGGLAGTVGTAMAERSRRWALHPRQAASVTYTFLVADALGVTIQNIYTLFNRYGPATDPGFQVNSGSVWGTYTAWNQADGTGDGSDGQYDNRTGYDALDRVVSVVGHAIRAWNAAASRISPSGRWFPRIARTTGRRLGPRR